MIIIVQAVLVGLKRDNPISISNLPFEKSHKADFSPLEISNPETIVRNNYRATCKKSFFT